MAPTLEPPHFVRVDDYVWLGYSFHLNTVPQITRQYFDAIRAPQKAYVLVPRTGHDPNAAMVDAQYKLLIERVLPLTR
ncbi:hypothetical protein [Rhodanobacter hydrolyticus]|uniref:Alpha/beta hydrolase n=1 Tax=Rhodanobacter hydrolyticus TaxID=2250595 RepID=A0ABW8J5G1_9GAMM